MVLRKLTLASLIFAMGALRAQSKPDGAELVFPQIYDARDGLGTKVLRINDQLTLNLKKSSILHDDFHVVTYREGAPLHSYPDVDELEEGLFHDEKHFASVVVTEDSGSVKVEGVVGPNIKIRPLEETERSSNGYIPHALELISQDPNIDTVFGKHFQQNNVTPVERSWRSNPYAVKKVYPEIRLVCDSVFQKGFVRKKDLVRYVMIELNVIKLRYLTVSNPEVHLRLRAIELTNKDQEWTFYEYLAYDTDIDALASLYKLVKYAEKRNNSYGRYDIIYFNTGMDMVTIQSGQRFDSIQGLAFVGSVCTTHKVGLGEDKAYSFIGIRIMAHELGHTLGCSHDGTEIAGQFKGYHADSTRCPWEHGYLMSYIEENANSMKFSTCCDYSMSRVAWSREISCLHNITSGSRLKKNKTRTLPGFFLSRNKQCRMTYPKLYRTYYMASYGLRGCRAECFVPGYQYGGADYHWPMYLIDGSPCGYGRVCINGDCTWKSRRYPVKIVGK